MTRTVNLAAALESRRAEINRISDATAQWFHVTGEIDIFGTGGAITDVIFPVFFVDKPRFSFGAELATGQTVISGNLPTCTVVVAQWDERGRDDGTPVYAGASLAVVTSGPTGQLMTAFWHMEGVGLRIQA